MGISEVVKQNLLSKCSGLKRRALAVINQLPEEDVSWSPNEESNSVAQLAAHIWGTVHQRVEVIFRDAPDTRNRDMEFEPGLTLSKEEAQSLIAKSFDLLSELLEPLQDEDLLRQPYLHVEVANSALSKNSTVLDIYLQMVTHLSEHVGQIFYIAKLRLNDSYKTTTVPRKK